MTSEVPSTQAASTATQPLGMRQRFAGRSLKGAVKQAGLTLTKREAQTIAKQSGKSVAEVMSGAVDQGVTLGSGLVNQFNRGKLGPNFQNVLPMFGSMFSPGQSKGFNRAIQNLQPLQNISMPAGSVYAGSTAVVKPSTQQRDVNSGFSSSPGSTTFLPVVLPKAVLKGAMSNISGDLGYSAPTQSGTAAESAAVSAAPAVTPPAAQPSPRAKAAKAKAQKVIAKRQRGAKAKQGQG